MISDISSMWMLVEHPLTRTGVRKCLEVTLSTWRLVEFFSFQELLDRAPVEGPTLLVVDLSLASNRGDLNIESLLANQPSLRILTVSSEPDAVLAARVFQAGALGYVSWLDPAEEFIQAVKEVAKGGGYCSPEIKALLHGGTGSPLENLSLREVDILRALCSGLSIMEIGTALSLSSKTISTYRQRLMSKLGLGNHAQLVVFAHTYLGSSSSH